MVKTPLLLGLLSMLLAAAGSAETKPNIDVDDLSNADILFNLHHPKEKQASITHPSD